MRRSSYVKREKRSPKRKKALNNSQVIPLYYRLPTQTGPEYYEVRLVAARKNGKHIELLNGGSSNPKDEAYFVLYKMYHKIAIITDGIYYSMFISDNNYGFYNNMADWWYRVRFATDEIDRPPCVLGVKAMIKDYIRNELES